MKQPSTQRYEQIEEEEEDAEEEGSTQLLQLGALLAPNGRGTTSFSKRTTVNG
jgi:hypothetical protein